MHPAHYNQVNKRTVTIIGNVSIHLLLLLKLLLLLLYLFLDHYYDYNLHFYP